MALDTESPTPWFNLGLLYQTVGRADDAIISLQKSIELGGTEPDAWLVLGCLLTRKEKHPEAVACFERVLAATPGNVEVACLLSLALAELKFDFSAIAVLEKTASLNPRNATVFSAMADYHIRRKAKDEAIACLRHAISLGSDKVDVLEYTIASLTGETTVAASPKQYVVDLFDDYAHRFESHLVEKLEYKTPGVLFERMAPLLGSDLDVLDLGCGTGLMGEYMRPMSKHLVGIDLSPKMLDQAAAKDIYDELVPAEICEFLDERPETYDVVLAADVFVYVGDLSTVFASVAKRLHVGGLFVFSVEALDGSDFRLNPSRRYSHSADYIARLAAEAEFSIVSQASGILRKEANEPDGKMRGLYYVLRKA